MYFNVITDNLYYFTLATVCVAGLRGRHFLLLVKCFRALLLNVWKSSKATLVDVEDADMTSLTLEMYKRLPFNSLSRLWGKFNQLPLPEVLREPAYRFYSYLFHCNLKEMAVDDLRKYKNLSEFFRRSLRPNVRPICPSSCLTSPADGHVLNVGVVRHGQLEQVKDLSYTLRSFLGPVCSEWSSVKSSLRRASSEPSRLTSMTQETGSRYQTSLKMKTDTELYHIVIYLAPGDYHRFHSAANWKVNYRRHFPGHLLSVNPSVARWIKNLFCLNERVVYYGDWEHGFFSYTAVGATNVGSIDVFFDKDLSTNQQRTKDFYDKNLHDNNQRLNKGELFGEFNLGSTIVMVFEAPRDFQFKVQPGDRVLVGQSIGAL